MLVFQTLLLRPTTTNGRSAATGGLAAGVREGAIAGDAHVLTVVAVYAGGRLFRSRGAANAHPIKTAQGLLSHIGYDKRP